MAASDWKKWLQRVERSYVSVLNQLTADWLIFLREAHPDVDECVNNVWDAMYALKRAAATKNPRWMKNARLVLMIAVGELRCRLRFYGLELDG